MMTHEGLLICDFCFRVIYPDDGTPVHLVIGERKFVFHYHNTLEVSCLKQKLEEMRQRFAAQTEGHEKTTQGSHPAAPDE
ncbi:MAG TPA: hypothetical protein VGF82_08105 [Terracidiphilus sp.]|jgi:hypothetical protein